MGITAEVIAAAGIFACGLGIAWAVFKPREASGLACWSVLYLDDNAVMQRTQVRVLSVWPTERRLVGWCSANGRERAFKVSKIVEARDAASGTPIDVERWMAGFMVQSGH